SVWLPIAMLAVWKAGGAFLPLDPSYPAERLSFMLADSGADLLLAESDLARLAIEETPAGGEIDRSDRSPNHLAYVIYTSGSTGTPKGVMIEHRGLANLIREQIEAFGITQQSRVLQLASASFDASVSEIWTAWLAGAALVMLPEGSISADADLLRRLRDDEVSVATFPPSLLASLPHAELPALATLVVAGEAANEALLARWSPGRSRVTSGRGGPRSPLRPRRRESPRRATRRAAGRPAERGGRWQRSLRRRAGAGAGPRPRRSILPAASPVPRPPPRRSRSRRPTRRSSPRPVAARGSAA